MRYILIFLFPAFLILAPSCSPNNENMPRETFALINVNIQEINCDDCYDQNLAVSSGFVVAENKSGGSYIFTAGHVCDTSDINDVFSLLENQNFQIEYSVENKRSISTAEIISVDLENDFCILFAKNIESKPLRISNKLPRIGERVYNLSAPLGIYNENFILEFEGFFAGEDGYGNSIYSIPAKPGSSGSPIFDKRGNLVGMTHSSAKRMENISISAELGIIRNYLKEQAKINPDMKIYLR